MGRRELATDRSVIDGKSTIQKGKYSPIIEWAKFEDCIANQSNYCKYLLYRRNFVHFFDIKNTLFKFK